MVQRIGFRVHGTVQGVSFRYFAQKKATTNNISGWVRNAPNGEVEGEAQGESDAISNLVRELNRGPSAAHVKKVDTHELDIMDGEEGFEVKA
ncbi:MAG: hypothetical protein M1818_008106 [Claussenomyces sp. TS43310]|nr:MAG: hypothetical protein M1818_008106 [Claussenomyces sp. TS43310]